RLYRQLTDIAFQSGLQVALFAPKPPADREDVAEVPIAMACEGGYHQLGAFFARMSRLPRIVDLGDFRLVSIERPTGTVRAEPTLAAPGLRGQGSPRSLRSGAGGQGEDRPRSRHGQARRDHQRQPAPGPGRNP